MAEPSTPFLKAHSPEKLGEVNEEAEGKLLR